MNGCNEVGDLPASLCLILELLAGLILIIDSFDLIFHYPGVAPLRVHAG